jgi:hypothetical protein
MSYAKKKEEQMKTIIPIKPHSSNSGFISTSNDPDYFNVRLNHFDPDGMLGAVAADTAEFDSMIYLAGSGELEPKDLKEITSDEQTAFYTYIRKLLSYLGSLYPQYVIREFCPVMANAITVSDGLFTNDAWIHELSMLEHQKLPTIVGLNNLIKDIMPVHLLADKYDLLNYPPSYLFGWCPNYTPVEISALRKELSNYSIDFLSACGKMKISTVQLSEGKFLSGIKVLKPFDVGNPLWRFHATSMFVTRRNTANNNNLDIMPVLGSTNENYEVTGNEAWLEQLGYFLPPSNLHAIVRMMFRKDASGGNEYNQIGCTGINDGGGLNDPVIAADKIYMAKTAYKDISGSNADAFTILDDNNLNRVLSAWPGLLAHTATANYGCQKYLGEADDIATFPVDKIIPFRWLNYQGKTPTDGTVWGTSYSLEQLFFKQIFHGGGKSITREK